VGKLIDRANPRWFAAFGLLCLSGALFWTASLLGPDTPIWMFLLPSALQGVANGFIWGPVSNATTRNLDPRQAGAGSGVFNTTRQIGAVLGSAAIAALIQSRLAAELPAAPAGAPAGEASMGGVLPEFLHAGFSTAMSQSILLPAFAVLVGAIVALFFAKPKSVSGWGGKAPAQAEEANAELQS
jgi:sugar phosphate permease